MIPASDFTVPQGTREIAMQKKKNGEAIAPLPELRPFLDALARIAVKQLLSKLEAVESPEQEASQR